ncbi:hypothetical protein ACKKBF_B02280 [Auxenochlorella protothecoides x Auxenochlorella symbiontica]
MSGHGTESFLGKRDSSGRRSSGIRRTASRYRGVTHHSRTNRYEAHVWSEGKQVYLGGYGLEVQAATAYDLAACKFRGQDAQTNFDIFRYSAELEDHTASQEEVVQHLRAQSKAMNCVAKDTNLTMEEWELEISATVHPDKEHLGVFADERAAARAVDRSCIQRLGLGATTSFPLVDYLDMLDGEHIQAAVKRGLLPPVLPTSYTPPPVPTPLLQLQRAARGPSPTLKRLNTPRAGEYDVSPISQPSGAQQAPAGSMQSPRPQATPGEGEANAHQGAELGVQVVPRRTSVTPRSVFDFMEFQTMLTGPSCAGKRLQEEADGSCKRARTDDPDAWMQEDALAMLDLQ